MVILDILLTVVLLCLYKIGKINLFYTIIICLGLLAHTAYLYCTNTVLCVFGIIILNRYDKENNIYHYLLTYKFEEKNITIPIQISENNIDVVNELNKCYENKAVLECEINKYLVVIHTPNKTIELNIRY